MLAGAGLSEKQTEMSYMRSPIYVIGSRQGIELMFPYNGEFAGNEFGYAADHFCMIPYDVFDTLVVNRVRRLIDSGEIDEAVDRYHRLNASYSETSVAETTANILAVFPRERTDDG